MSLLLREFVCGVLAEGLSEIPEEVWLDVAEYVGANEPFDLDRAMPYLKPFVTTYRGLYRVWSGVALGTSAEELTKMVAGRRTVAATRSAEAIESMMEDLVWSERERSVVTQFDGEGFDPYAFLRAGLRRNPDHHEAKFVRQVLADNEFQQEVVVLRVLGPQRVVETPSE